MGRRGRRSASTTVRRRRTAAAAQPPLPRSLVRAPPAVPAVTVSLPDTLALNLPQVQGADVAHLWLSAARGATAAHAARVTHTHDVTQLLLPASLRALEKRDSDSGSTPQALPFDSLLTYDVLTHPGPRRRSHAWVSHCRRAAARIGRRWVLDLHAPAHR